MCLEVRERIRRPTRCAEPATPTGQQRGIPRHLYRDGGDGGERRRSETHHPRRNGSGCRQESDTSRRVTRRWVLRPRDHPGRAEEWHHDATRRRAAAEHNHGGAGHTEAGLPRERAGHGWQFLPAQRWRGRGRHHLRPQGEGAGPQAAGADHRHRGIGARARDHGPRSNRGLAPGAEAGKDDHRRRRHRRDQRSVCRAGHSRSARARRRSLQRHPHSAWGRDRARPSIRHDGGSHPVHAVEWPFHRRQDHWTGDDVRRRRAGDGDDRRTPRVTDVAIETGGKRVFAAALDWPGWCPSAKDERTALATLGGYAARFAPVAKKARITFDPRTDATFRVVEHLAGTATTDFGAPDAVAKRDTTPLAAPEAKKIAALLNAAWVTFDAVISGAPAELRKGPRGGGRDRDQIAGHVLGAEGAYARKLGLALKAPARDDRRGIAEFRTALTQVLGRPSNGEALVDRGWPQRYAARRIAWHALDHAWEIQDRSAPSKG